MKYVFILLTALSLNCFGNEIDVYLKDHGFHEKAIPKGEALHKANHSQSEYCVELNSGKIHIRKQLTSCKALPPKLAIGNLTYSGTDQGEWGGEFSVTDSRGEKKILIKDNLVSIVQHNKELFVFTGLAHLGLSKGTIHKVFQIDTQPVVEKLADLSSAPQVVLTSIENSNLIFIIITSDGIIRFTPSTRKVETLTYEFFGFLYPSSAMIKDKVLLIGMRSGVVQIDLNSEFMTAKARYFSK